MIVLRLLGRVALALVTIVVVALVAFAVAILVGFPVSLDPFRGEFESMASSSLGRKVTIEGKMEIVPTLWPTLEIEGLRIGQPPDWPERPGAGVEGGGFARAEHAFLRLGVVPLLRGRLHVLALTGTGFEVDMERLADGRVNWLMKLPDPAEADEVSDEPLPEGINEPLLLQLKAIDGISFRDVRLRYQAPGAVPWEFELEELSGTVALDAAFELKMRGALQGERYALDFRGDPLHALLTRDEPWPVDIRTELGGAVLKLDGQVMSRWNDEPTENEGTEKSAVAQFGPFQFHALDLGVDLEGGRLDRFHRILGLPLPRLGPYRMTGSLVLRNGQFSISDLGLSVGSSRLSGKMSWNHLGPRPRFDIALRAPNIQLADFPGWEKILEDDEVEPPTENTALRKRKLSTLTSETADSIDGSLRVDVDRVMSGRDKLGAMHFVMKLEPDRLQLDPFTLAVPGGSVGIRFTSIEQKGNFALDLADETIELEFEPVSKKPEFFSLATPVVVEGDFEDFEVAVRPEDMIGTVIRFVTSVVVVPVQRFIGLMTKLSDDAICQKALDREALEAK